VARRADASAENAAGELFVDSSCIDCDLCRQLAPAVFARTARRGQSYVARQPATDAERHRALMALVTCPTSSIGTAHKPGTRAAARAFPEPIDGVPGVLFCGYASAASYGAASWLVRRPDGNVLVDSPRWATVLAERIAELGGVGTMVLTHRDDVADHEAWRERFGCERVIHAADVSAGTRACERVIEGEAEVRLAPDLIVIPVPGHTRGSIALLSLPHEGVLFSGDHVWATDDQQGLECGRDVCWYSWPEQRRSIEKLAGYDFTHVLPGHGRRFRAQSAAAMRAELVRLARAM
jgi:glyoxylase-like metal-dependent hydrolase (beta-lactamase superfamily II)/ferredoxin